MADVRRNCKAAGWWIRSNSRRLGSAHGIHMAKLWVLWHCWARIEDAATVGTGSPLQPHTHSAVLVDGLSGWVGREVIKRPSNSWLQCCNGYMVAFGSWLWERGFVGGGKQSMAAKGPHM